MAHDPLAVTAAVSIVAGVASQALARRMRLPAIVPLLFAGVLLGPAVLGVVQPQAMGQGLRVVVGLAVAIILFEGGLSLKIDALRKAGRAIRNLITYGALVTWTLSATFAHWLFPDLGLGPAVLFGSLVIVTGPTVIQPLIHAVHPRKRVADVLRGEGILIDPIGALLAALVLEFLLEAGGGASGTIFLAFGGRILLGCILGALGALTLNFLLRKNLLPGDVRNLAVLSGAVGLYALSEFLAHESGVLTVTLAGFLLGVLHPPGLEEIEEFKGHITVLMVSCVFILLSANLSMSGMLDLGWPGVLLVALLIVVVRPLSVFLCTLGTELSLRERLFLSWIAPRGILAAAVSSLFAILLEAEGRPEGAIVMNMTFAVIVGTVVLQGATARRVGRLLHVVEEELKGFLIVGANVVGLRLGRALDRAGCRVVITDTNPWRVRQAEQAGLAARCIDVLDEVVMDEQDLDGIGNLLCLTPSDSVNRLAVRIYKRDYGRSHVRAIRMQSSPSSEEVPDGIPYLFGERLDWEEAARRLEAGEQIGKAQVDHELGLDSLSELVEGALALFAFDAEGRVRFLDDGATLSMGETLFYLAPE